MHNVHTFYTGMYRIVFLALVAYIALIQADKFCQQIIDEQIKTLGYVQWKPYCEKGRSERPYPPFGALPDAPTDGLNPDPPKERTIPMQNRIIPIKPGESRPFIPQRLPDNYDARKVWGKECPSYNYIGTQGWKCANCWAVAATTMINDRICQYKQKGREQIMYSIKQPTACLNRCDGGHVNKVLDMWIQYGLVTGGDNRTEFTDDHLLGCQPYPEDPYDLVNATCTDQCDNGRWATNWEQNFGAYRYEITNRNIWDIMWEIYIFGPVVALFQPYEDFQRYDGVGVYKHVTGNQTAMKHYLKLVGWGVENGTQYWLGANSWDNTWWGDKGFVKFQRGTNDCGIEDVITVALPREGMYWNQG